MHIIKVNLKSRSYNVFVGSRILYLLGKHIVQAGIGNDAYIITNPRVKRLFGKELACVLKKGSFSFRFKTIPDTEKSKDIKIAALLVKDLARFDLKKKPFIIAFGGGVIGDLSGFVAAIYKRGIPYIQIPTTLLAQVDSSIGGKTAVDLSEGKNLAGAFYQPSLVFSDTAFLKTLSKRQIANGLAEVIKYGVIKDRSLILFLEREYKNILRLKDASLSYIVNACAKIKAAIVSVDEKEDKGLRTQLNFGHTIGHAIEAASGFKGYYHGEAIALGMLVALEISLKMKLINESTLKRIESLIKNVGLPIRITKLATSEILKKHFYDKKFSGKSNKFVLTNGLGNFKIVRNIPLSLIRYAIDKRRTR